MITTENLTVSYEDDCLALEDVSVHIEGPAIVGLLGPNGAGKSTFIKAILNLITYSGKIYIDGKENSADKGQIAYVKQKSQIDYNFPMTVKECVSLGTYAKLGLFHRPSKAEWRKVFEVMKQVGLSEFADRPIKALSGGQFQRMLIARCLVQEADYIFLDEPFVGIDSISETIITNLLRDLKKSGKTILIVHHDLSKARSYFDHLLMINKNLVAYGKVEDIFTKENLRATYGDNIFLGKES
ncbi:metal ABC transporter ATP-binding protein [Streptococcus orisratti]|uniref:metal ABC transporter ATP-binding protein n=1 Tax=Streptococcus orisratti TaxID=114652 RepID=UPI003D07141E